MTKYINILFSLHKRVCFFCGVQKQKGLCFTIPFADQEFLFAKLTAIFDPIRLSSNVPAAIAVPNFVLSAVKTSISINLLPSFITMVALSIIYLSIICVNFDLCCGAVSILLAADRNKLFSIKHTLPFVIVYADYAKAKRLSRS